MKDIPYCLPQILEDVLATATLVSEDDFIHNKVVSHVLGELAALDGFGEDPTDLALTCLRSSYKALGVRDPYESEKSDLNQLAENTLPRIEGYLAECEDTLTTKIKLAAIASGLDYTATSTEHLANEIITGSMEVSHDESEELSSALLKAESVLYILDSAGEIVIDRLLIEEIKSRGIKVSVAVSSQPVLCRALEKDAQEVGINNFAEIISPGADMLGISIKKSSSNFQELFKSADVVISKGESNFQTLYGCNRDVFHLLCFTCSDCAKKVEMRKHESAITFLRTEEVTVEK